MRITLLALFLALVQAVAEAEISPTLELDAVRVEITWVTSEAEMKRLRRTYGGAPRDHVIRTDLKAFSVLGKRGGEHVCLVYAFRPRNVNDDFTTSLGHEIAHCFLGAYH